MGFYTYLEIDVMLSSETPFEVVDALTYMKNPIKITGKFFTLKEGKSYGHMNLPNHYLFQTPRWIMLMRGSDGSDWVEPPVFEVLLDGRWKLKVKSAFKHYDDEIPLFRDFINRWIVEYNTFDYRDENEMWAAKL